MIDYNVQKNMIKVGSGLNNLGNTCFFNAVLQCLLHAKPVAQILLNKEHSKNCDKNGWCVFCELEKTWFRTKQEKVVDPRGLISNLKSLFKKFQLGRQEDAHEFLRYFVEGLQKAEVGDEKNIEKLKEKVEKSQIYRIFGGKIKSVVECLNCHQKSEIYEHYYDMSLECQKSNSIREAFDNYFKVDQLTGNNKYKCEKCKRESNATKRFLFSQFPAVFTLQLKRFTNNLRKIGKYISYDTVLNLSKYSENNQQNVLYDLCGVVVHAGGSSFSGHYYSFVRSDDNDWFRMDDNWVSKSNEGTVLKQNSYLLFYRRRNFVNVKKSPEKLLAERMEIEKPVKKQVISNPSTQNSTRPKEQYENHKTNNKQEKVIQFTKNPNENKSDAPCSFISKLQQQHRQQQQMKQMSLPRMVRGCSIQELFTLPPLKSSNSINQDWLARMICTIVRPKKYPRRLERLRRLQKYQSSVRKQCKTK